MAGFEFTACTWNMQRGRTVSAREQNELPETRLTRAARLQALRYLCDTYDVVFLQEVGQDLEGNEAAAHAGGMWHWDRREDNQSQGHACRSAVFVGRGRLVGQTLPHQSGKSTAFRYPASAVWRAGFSRESGDNVLLVSFHATSGGGGLDDTRGLQQALDDTVSQACPTALVGADFNSRSRLLSMPSAPTHQRGDFLDGFFATNVDAPDPEDPTIHLSQADREGGFGLMTDLRMRPVDEALAAAMERTGAVGRIPASIRARIAAEALPAAPGCYFAGRRISDHIPVVVRARVEWDEGSDEEEDGWDPRSRLKRRRSGSDLD